MPAITLAGHMSAGHDGFPPRPSIEGCSRVTVGGVPVHCEGHAWAEHASGGSSHAGHLAVGAPHVTIGGRGVGRVGDLITCGDRVAQGCKNVTVGNCGGEDFARDMMFESLTDPKDKLILCLPEMAAAQAERVDAVNREGWLYLHDAVQKWLNRPAYVLKDIMDNGGQEPFWIDWNWLMQYARFQSAIRDLTSTAYLIDPAAQKTLTSMLKEDGHFSGAGDQFDYTSLRWQDWRRRAFHGRTIGKWQGLDPDWQILPDGFMAILASTTVYVLAAGRTVWNDNTSRWGVYVNRVGCFIHDGFDFAGDNDWLGSWECSETYKGFSITGIPLRNADFHNFRNRTGYGCDFRTMCPMHIAEIEGYGYYVP